MTANSAPPSDPEALARRLLHEAGCAPAAIPLQVSGAEPVLPSAYPLATAAAGVLGACGVALAAVWAAATGRTQSVAVDLRRAGAALISFRLQQLNGVATPGPGDGHPLVGLHRCRDGRWLAIHGGFDSLEGPTLQILGCALDRSEVARRIAQLDAAQWEERFADARMCGVMVRTAAEWRDHPQGGALAASPCVEVVKIGESAPVPLLARERPLESVRILDLTRVLAGPSCGKFLASAGAQVLAVSCPRLPNVDAYLLENGHGKRAAILDLDDAGDAQTAMQLARGADVVVDSYRSGSLERRGLGAHALAAQRPGLIYASINCYGPEGEWRTRPGWELIAQSAVGLAVGHGSYAKPALIRAYPCDYLTGYLAALGILAALLLRSREGGSYHVRASLCRSGMLVESLGAQMDVQHGGEASAMTHVDGTTPTAAAFEHFCREGVSAFGRVRYFPPAVDLSDTPLYWGHLAARPGDHPPAWI